MFLEYIAATKVSDHPSLPLRPPPRRAPSGAPKRMRVLSLSLKEKKAGTKLAPILGDISGRPIHVQCRSRTTSPAGARQGAPARDIYTYPGKIKIHLKEADDTGEAQKGVGAGAGRAGGGKVKTLVAAMYSKIRHILFLLYITYFKNILYLQI